MCLSLLLMPLPPLHQPNDHVMRSHIHTLTQSLRYLHVCLYVSVVIGYLMTNHRSHWLPPYEALKKTNLLDTSSHIGDSQTTGAESEREEDTHLPGTQDEFQQQNCTVGSLHDSDHEDLVRTFVGPSCGLGGFLFVYICITTPEETPRLYQYSSFNCNVRG